MVLSYLHSKLQVFNIIFSLVPHDVKRGNGAIDFECECLWNVEFLLKQGSCSSLLVSKGHFTHEPRAVTMKL